MPWNVLIRPGSPGSAPSLRRTRDTQTRRYWRSSRYSGPQTLVRSSVWRTTLPAFAARCWSKSHSVRESWTSSPSRVTIRRSRSISTSSKASTPEPGWAPDDRRSTARTRASFAELAHDLDAVEVGHDDVQEHDVRADLLGLRECLLAAAGGDDPESFFPEGDRHELGDPWFVIGDEDEWLGAHGRLQSMTW